MLTENSPFLVLDRSCEEAIKWLTERVGRMGLSLARTFDLQVARQAHTDCPCPYHGTGQCDCQMVVLLIHASQAAPLSLVAHAHDGQTWFSIVDTPQQRANPHLVEQLLRMMEAVA